MNVRNEDPKKSHCRDSLVAQWLKEKKYPTANSGDMGSILDLGRSHILQGNEAREPPPPPPLSLCSRPQEPQLLNPHAAVTEAHVP